MSLNQIIDNGNIAEDWVNIRVNNLKIDGNIEPSNEVTGTINWSGAFVKNSDYKALVIGNLVTVTLLQVTGSTVANDELIGNVLDASIRPAVEIDITIPVSENSLEGLGVIRILPSGELIVRPGAFSLSTIDTSSYSDPISKANLDNFLAQLRLEDNNKIIYRDFNNGQPGSGIGRDITFTYRLD